MALAHPSSHCAKCGESFLKIWPAEQRSADLTQTAVQAAVSVARQGGVASLCLVCPEETDEGRQEGPEAETPLSPASRRGCLHADSLRCLGEALVATKSVDRLLRLLLCCHRQRTLSDPQLLLIATSAQVRAARLLSLDKTRIAISLVERSPPKGQGVKICVGLIRSGRLQGSSFNASVCRVAQSAPKHRL